MVTEKLVKYHVSRPEGKRRINIAQEVRDIIKVNHGAVQIGDLRKYEEVQAQSLIGIITTERMIAREWTSKRTGKEKKKL